MMLLWALTSVLFAIFIVNVDGGAVSVPLKLQPFSFGILALISYLQTILYHETRKNPLRSTIIHGSFCVLLAIASLVPGILFATDPTVLTAIGAAAGVFLGIGFIPQFVEIYRMVLLFPSNL
jgi:hypothetical protein